jgi:hypothetical protein
MRSSFPPSETEVRSLISLGPTNQDRFFGDRLAGRQVDDLTNVPIEHRADLFDSIIVTKGGTGTAPMILKNHKQGHQRGFIRRS